MKILIILDVHLSQWICFKIGIYLLYTLLINVCKFHKNRDKWFGFTGSLKSQIIGFICLYWVLSRNVKIYYLYAKYVERVTDCVAFRFLRYKHSVIPF